MFGQSKMIMDFRRSSKNNITIVQALRANDETAVTLQGHIVGQIKHEHYELKDTTGSMAIEVDDDLRQQIN
jgi:uncharacterized protein (TIGR00156 family)